ncbi:MAG: 50S ribosomal protein L18e [Candidatus Hydrothermarchaeales archaeon]
MRKSKSSNSVLIGLIEELNKKSYTEKVAVWRDLAKRLNKPASRRASVNVGRIARHTEKKDIVAVPGKVLGSGTLRHPLTVAAFEFSSQAKAKIMSADGECLSLSELMDTKTKAKGIKIME